MNPAIDIGQVEGGYVQGAGWLTTEELVWDDHGRLRTHAPSTYKIPAMSDRPREFNVNLWDRGNLKPTIYRSKAVGEPPFMLGISAWLALSDAISNCGPAYPNLDAPATPERVLKAVEGFSMAFDLQRLKQLIDATDGSRVVIQMCADQPHTVGTEMFVWDNGQDGTIGGGALEYQVTNAAEQALKEQRTWAHTYPLGPNLGQCCGGSVGILCEVFDHTTLPTASADVVKRPAPSQMKPINHSNLTVQNGEIHEPCAQVVNQFGFGARVMWGVH